VTALFAQPETEIEPCGAFTPREYQLSLINAVLADYREGVRSVLVVLATGLGKTIIAGFVIRDFSRARCLVIAHRDELLRQAGDKLGAITGRTIHYEKAAEYAPRHGQNDIVVASVQTLIAGWNGTQRRYERFEPRDFDLIFVDEAHHAIADSYRLPLGAFRERNPDLCILGMTATPDRMDEESLGQIFDSVHDEYDLPSAWRDGYLVEPHLSPIRVGEIDLSRVRVTAGDFNKGQLGAILAAHDSVAKMAKPAFEAADGRRSLVFAVDVAQAEAWAMFLEELAPGRVAVVSGTTHPDERRRIMQGFGDGRIQFLCNCQIATEGWDDPARDTEGVQCAIMARPTQSRALYAQMVGRILRTVPANLPDQGETADERLALIRASAKPYAEVIDFTGYNVAQHKLVTIFDVLGGRYTDRQIALADRALAARSGNVREALEEARQRMHEEYERELQQRRVRSGIIVENWWERGARIDPYAVLGIEPERERGWHRGRLPTQNMRLFLEGRGVDASSLTFTQAAQIITEMRARGMCSQKQAKQLAQRGLDPNIYGRVAGPLMAYLVQNRWIVPREAFRAEADRLLREHQANEPQRPRAGS
jgi:superfamily II DNA or RNA helicase